MHHLSKNELLECIKLCLKYVQNKETLLQFVEIERERCLTIGCHNYENDVQNKDLYSFAHAYLFHKKWWKCEVCQKVLNARMYRYHALANCDDEQGGKSYSEYLS